MGRSFIRMLSGVLALGLAALTGCGESGAGGTGGTGGIDNSPYASKDLWTCRPDIENDYCDTADMSTTEIQPDGTMVVLDEVTSNPNAGADCFVVYPSVNYSSEPGNTETLIPPPDEVVQVTYWMAAAYRGVCRLFLPLYHQMSEITYTAFLNEWEGTEYFQRAYDDIVEAFDYYMRRFNGGRGIVFIGHSQGSHMLTKLMEDRFDDDEALRGQLVSAVLMGPGNRVQVLEGEDRGGSFDNIPLCTSAKQTGCAIAFDASAAGVPTVYEAGVSYPPPSARACVNPAKIDGGSGTLAGFTYPRSSWSLGPYFPEGVDTEWVRYSKLYTSWCAGADQRHVLLVDVASDYAGEVPLTPEELQDIAVASGHTLLNLHPHERYLTSADVVRIVEQQIAAWSSN
jgi:hypothetical protein